MKNAHKFLTRIKTALIAFIVVMGFFSVAYAQDEAEQAPAADANVPSMNVTARSAVLMEPTTGRILLAQNPHEKLAPASVTKVMTMLLIYEALDDDKIKWDDMVTVSTHAASMGGSQVYLEVMEQQTVRDLTKSVVVASANDAAVAMAEYIAGSEDGFVTMMNNKAKSLGMNDTHFVNACGLDADGHYTSAYDIAIMSRELVTKYPQIHEFSKIWMDKIVHKTARGFEDFGLSNTNRLIRSYQGATGLKTGSTSQALYCISATAERNGLSLIAVVMGAPDPTTRFGEAIKMMDYGFANYAMAPGDAAGTVMGEMAVSKGKDDTVALMVKKQVSALVPKGKTVELTRKTEVTGSLEAPVAEGAKAGEVIYYYEGNEVGRSDLVAAEAVPRASLMDNIRRNLYRWCK